MGLVAQEARAGPSQAGASPAARAATVAVSALPAVVIGGFTDYVVGNRQRMTQFAFVGFGIGILILVTATRKH